MGPHPQRRLFSRIATATALASALIGVLVILGWMLGIVSPLSNASGRVMQPVPALAFVLGGGSLWLLRRPGALGEAAGAWLALPVLVIGALTVVEHLTSNDLGIDRSFDPLFPSGAHGTRMSALSAVCFLLQGFSLMRYHWPPRMRVAAQIAAMTSVGIAVVVLVDYFYNVSTAYRLDAQSVMAIHTAAAFVLLGIGTLASDPDVGLMRVLARPGPGGQLTRTLLPIMAVAPFVLGWMRLEGQRLGYYDDATGVALLATMSAATITAMVMIYARRVNDLDRTRSAAERTVVESNQFHQQIIQSALEGISVTDTEGRLVLFNAFMEEYTGLRSRDVLGRRLSDVFPEAAAPFVRDAFAGVLQGRNVEFPDAHRRTASGEMWTRTRLSPIRNARGEVTGALAFTSDITDRKMSEMDLHEEQERTRLAMNAAAMAAWQVDIETAAVIGAEELAALFGHPSESFDRFGMGSEFIHPDDTVRVRDTVDAAMRNRSAFAFDFRVVGADGGLRWLSTSGRYSPEGRKGRLLGVTMDVTHRRTLEAQLRQAQKMDAIGRLAGGIAHDFNNLLTAVLGYADLLESSELDQEQRRDIQEIVKAGHRATSLTRQLLAFSRRQIVQSEVLDINATVNSLANMLRRLIGEQIELTATLAAQVAAVRADPGQIEQVVVNLVLNARDAMPGGGYVRIETANVSLDATSLERSMVTPGEYVMLAVSDTGTGMTEDVRARAFEPFFTTKDQGKGTGLGLATVYGIVTQSGGHVSLYSEPGQGTTFKVYLPAVAQEDVDGTGEVAAGTAGLVKGRGTVLVVEDEDAVRALTCTILERAGYSVHAAGNPQQAQVLFHELAGRVDLLLTDVIMPGGSGPQLHQRLSGSGEPLRVLYMSGYTGQAAQDQGRLDADAPFLQKPFSGETLTRRVRDVLA